MLIPNDAGRAVFGNTGWRPQPAPNMTRFGSRVHATARTRRLGRDARPPSNIAVFFSWAGSGSRC